MVVAALVVSGCTSKITVSSVEPAPSPASGKFVAGVGKVDLTPPPGIPLFGYSWAGSNVGAGVRTRLYARALYLEDSSGERIALVQCDLGAISSLLHKSVASLVTHDTGISADRLLLAATHTHSAPGGYFGTGLYDNFGATRIGFDPEMLEFLSTRIARAIEQAYQRRAPAKLAIGQIAIHTLTRNRSLDGYLHDAHHADVNVPPFEEPPEYLAVNPTFTMIRVDRTAGGISQPLGAFSNFAIHGTVVSEKNDLYNADLHAAAERALEQQLKKDFKLRDEIVIHALTNGNEGDVQAAYTAQSFSEAERIGNAIGARAVALFNQLGAQLTDQVSIAHNYEEVPLSGSNVREPDGICADGSVGFPTIGGSEESRTAWYHFGLAFGLIPAYEGARRSKPWGCQGVKIKALWGLTATLNGSLPTRLPLQTIRINDLLLIALPGEFTTEMGNRIMATAAQTARASHQKVQETAIIGLANEYSSYFTTPEEYDVQDYEGSSTLFGPRSGPFIEKKVGHLVEQMADASHHPQVEKSWTFTTGIVRRHFPVARAGFALRQAIAVEVNCESLSPSASFSWRDLPPGAIGMDAPLVRIEAERDGKWVPYVNDGVPEDDQGLNLEIRLVAEALDKDSAEWRATWYAAPPPARSFRFGISKRDTVNEITSEPVKFNCPAAR